MKPRVYFREYRDRVGQTLKQVAAKMEVSPQTIHKWEQSINSPSIPDLIKLATVYAIHPSAFFISPDEPPLRESDDDTVKVMAKLAGIDPLAFRWISGDLTKLDEAEELTLILEVFRSLPSALRKHWAKIGQSYLELLHSLPLSVRKHWQKNDDERPFNEPDHVQAS